MAMPDQPVWALGVEAVAIAAVTAIIVGGFGLRGLKDAETPFRRNFLLNVLSNIGVLLPIIVGGLMMLSGGDTGFYWVGAGMCAVIVKAVSEGWIFLVEINR
jgi:hypothetical protein